MVCTSGGTPTSTPGGISEIFQEFIWANTKYAYWDLFMICTVFFLRSNFFESTCF